MSRKTTRQLVPLKQAAGDLVDEDYGILCPSRDDQPAGLRVTVLVLAVLHIILALASIAIGVAAICINVTSYYVGYGVWCGLIVSDPPANMRVYRRLPWNMQTPWFPGIGVNLCKAARLEPPHFSNSKAFSLLSPSTFCHMKLSSVGTVVYQTRNDSK